MKVSSNKKIVLEMTEHDAWMLKECLSYFSRHNKDKGEPFVGFAKNVAGEVDKEHCKKI